MNSFNAQGFLCGSEHPQVSRLICMLLGKPDRTAPEEFLITPGSGGLSPAACPREHEHAARHPHSRGWSWTASKER